MAGKVLAASRGIVLSIHKPAKDGVTTNNRAILTCSRFDPNTTKFVGSDVSDIHIQGEDQILQCSIIENFHTGIIAPCLLIERFDKDNNVHQGAQEQTHCTLYTNQVLFFCPEKEQFSVAGSFSTSTSLSKSNVWLLSGPTVCWEHNGHLNVVVVKAGKSESDKFATQFPSPLFWTTEHTLKWCDVNNGDLLILATHPHHSVDDESSSSWFEFEDVNLKRKWTLMKCPKRDLGKSCIIDCLLIPDVYSSIVKCLHINYEHHDNNKTCAKLSKSHILAATNQGQLLEFREGKVNLVCDLLFNDTCKILTVARMGSSDLVLVMAQSGTVCAIERNTFKILEEWCNMSAVLIDDFLFDGTEQILMVPSATSGDSNMLESFILTDLESCFINVSKNKEDGDESAEDSKLECGENLLSAIQALAARLQSELAALRADQTKYDDKRKLIAQSQHALRNMVGLEEDISMNKALQNDLVCIHDGLTQDDQHHSDSLTTDDYYGMVEVSNGWQRVVDLKWVVGVDLRNNSPRAMQNINLVLVPINDNTHLGLQPMTSQCRPKFPSYNVLPTQKNLADVQPEIKRRKTNRKDRQILDCPVRLCPGEQTSVVAMTPVPEFTGSSMMCCDMLLQWKEMVTETETVGDKNKACMRERTKSCGRVWLSAVDVVNGNLGVEIVPSTGKSAAKLQQDLHALSAVQMSTALNVTSLHSNLSCIPKVLQCIMGFISTTLHDGLVYPKAGVLWGVRVQLEGNDPYRGQMNVWTRDKKQLMLLCHMLHQHLPEDIALHPSCTPVDQMEQSITSSIHAMKEELSSQVKELQNMQMSSSKIQDQPSVRNTTQEPMDVDEGSKVTEQTSRMGLEVTEEARDMAEVQRHFERDHLKLTDCKVTLFADKDRLRHTEIEANRNTQQTNRTVQELARNLLH